MLVISKKICMIGDFSVGKTSLIRRYMDNQFSDQYLTTVGVKISRKLMAIPQSSLTNASEICLESNKQLGHNLPNIATNVQNGNMPNNSQNNAQNNVQNTNLQMLIWDLEGSTKFQGIVPTYLQGASGALVVADIMRLSTIENLKSHVELFCSINPHSPIVIVLNKSDLCLEETRTNLILDVKKKMYQNILSVLHTSAKEDVGVTEAFKILANYIVKP